MTCFFAYFLSHFDYQAINLIVRVQKKVADLLRVWITEI